MNDDLISRQAAIESADEIISRDDSGNNDVVKAMTAWKEFIKALPSVQPEQSIAEWQKDFREYINMLNIPRDDYKGIMEYINEVPSAQPEIIHCCDCIYYDPEHIEKNGVRYEYRDMPKDAFDILGTGMVNSEYGINVGGRCCRDFNIGYSEDKRVFVSGQNYCGRAGRRQDADSSGNMSGTQKELKRTETHSCDCERTETHESRREWYMKGYRDAQRWIPVTERLPEDACQCIVTAKVKHVDNYPDYEVDTADFADGIFTTANSWWGVESIIAWMPLPEAYREKKSHEQSNH